MNPFQSQARFYPELYLQNVIGPILLVKAIESVHLHHHFLLHLLKTFRSNILQRQRMIFLLNSPLRIYPVELLENQETERHLKVYLINSSVVSMVTNTLNSKMINVLSLSLSLSYIDLLNKDKQPNDQEKEMEISGPYNAKHVTHVGFDASTGEFTGLPQEWQTLLQHSGISKREQYQNPQVTLDNKRYFFFLLIIISGCIRCHWILSRKH